MPYGIFWAFSAFSSMCIKKGVKPDISSIIAYITVTFQTTVIHSFTIVQFFQICILLFFGSCFFLCFSRDFKKKFKRLFKRKKENNWKTINPSLLLSCHMYSVPGVYLGGNYSNQYKDSSLSLWSVSDLDTVNSESCYLHTNSTLKR